MSAPGLGVTVLDDGIAIRTEPSTLQAARSAIGPALRGNADVTIYPIDA